jgi:hypothetical protein
VCVCVCVCVCVSVHPPTRPILMVMVILILILIPIFINKDVLEWRVSWRREMGVFKQFLFSFFSHFGSSLRLLPIMSLHRS